MAAYSPEKVLKSVAEQRLSLAQLWKGYAVAKYSDAGRGEGIARHRAVKALK